ncbi:hypothetical protein M427DRAFT_61929 [Gonapodya prolifera JEL478]|uniref:RanBP2-type domain-containing protein n=1 Tax=Gonapodya prolifera (strain JEL478) TaxID=1344416 RepID=A0A139A1A8_GONPJ|nr:hypothetical protein M427DRAFT_61929 [Gonapodya prolifera JEL478]|eukprot:KXS10567.1 hypothetical protein M427DRAFT_61929 [Gonapodya prolifera JEL478]
MNGAKDSKGLFSPSDWRCTGCGNVNWSKRISCNICNNPKPGLGPQGNREGYGGGFMDREEQVEYRDTRFRDNDEFDEFGRRKKKRSHREGTGESKRSVSEDPNSAAKEPLREEEDDDGDVDPELLKAWGLDEDDRSDPRNGGGRDGERTSHRDRGDERDRENGRRDEQHHQHERSRREDDRERSPPRFRNNNTDEWRGERPRNRSRSPRDSRNERNRDEREDRYHGKDQGSRRGRDEPRDSRDR